MDFRTVETSRGVLSTISFGEGESITKYSEFFDAIMTAPSNTLVVRQEDITEKFFVLSSGLAGEILQKVSTYRKRLVILGQFSQIESKSLKDFIFESNRTGQVVFAESLEKALELLR